MLSIRASSETVAVDGTVPSSDNFPWHHPDTNVATAVIPTIQQQTKLVQ
jgi:hypothetical protein